MITTNFSKPFTRCLGAWALVATVVVPGLATTGCSTGPVATDPHPTRQLTKDADAVLAEAVAAVRRGDLDQAADRIAQAQRMAQTPNQTRQAQSLHHLVVGARAMLAGDARGAGQAWARIGDPALRKEVHLLADRIDIDVPVVVASNPESEIRYE